MKRSKKQHKKTRARVKYARPNPGVSTLMLVNPTEHKAIDTITKRLSSIEQKLGSKKGRSMPRKRARTHHKPKQGIGKQIAQEIKKVVSQASERTHGRRGRQRQAVHQRDRHGRFLPDGRVNVHAIRSNRRPEDRGLIALDRAHRSVRWERRNGKPTAKYYVDRHFASVNPSIGDLGSAALAPAAGFFGSRIVGNLFPRLPVVGSMLGGWSKVVGTALGGALAYFFFPERWRHHRTAVIAGAAVATIDAGLRQLAPGLQGVLGDGEPEVSVGQLPPAETGVGCDRQLPAHASVQPIGAYMQEGTSGYVEQTGAEDDMSGYVSPEGEHTGDSEDGMSGPQYRPVVHRTRNPYRVVIECHGPHDWLHKLPAHARVVTVAEPPKPTLALPPAQMPQQAHPMPPSFIGSMMPKPAKPLAGGIFSE
jgi:hypothetical protein